MPKIKTNNNYDGRYDLPEGTHIAYCIFIVDLGTQPGSALYPDPKRIVKLAFEIPGETYTDDNGNVKPKIIYSQYTLSTAEKAKFRPVFEALFQGTPTEEDYINIDFNKLIGSLVSVTVRKNGEYTNVTQVSKVPNGINFEIPMYNDPVVLDLDDFDKSVFDKLGEKMKEKIMNSPEYNETINSPFQNVEEGEPF